MGASTRDSIVSYLRVLDGHLVETGRSTPLYLSGGAAVVLAYGSTDRTKDVDAFVPQRSDVLDELQAWAGKNTAVARREGYFFEVVPPIYPMAPDMFKRAIPIEGLNLQAINPVCNRAARHHHHQAGSLLRQGSFGHRAFDPHPRISGGAPGRPLCARAR